MSYRISSFLCDFDSIFRELSAAEETIGRTRARLEYLERDRNFELVIPYLENVAYFSLVIANTLRRDNGLRRSGGSNSSPNLCRARAA